MEYATTNHLILVCCHAIYNPFSTSANPIPNPSTTLGLDPDPSQDASWLLFLFQTSEPPTFIAHARAGLKLLAASPETSLLVFSGSKTRPEVEKSEARSYLDLCAGEGFWGLLDGRDCEGIKGGGGEGGEEIKKRILLEEQALDSFSNILFSLLLFWKTTRHYPSKLTIITHAFKRPRFLALHIPALRYPSHRVDFIGIDPSYMVPGSETFDGEKAEEVRKGERERGYAAWEGDLYGRGTVLRGKRRGRNFWGGGQLFFGYGGWEEKESEREKERRESRVKIRVLEWVDERGEVVREDVLDMESGRQPWEEAELGG